MKLLTPIGDYSRTGSLAWKLRQRRFQRFANLVARTGKSNVRILDIGGTQQFWEVMGYVGSGHEITLVNLFEQQSRHDNITTVVGNACHLEQYDDRSFDIVFSNSVIEHVGTFDDQRLMANEVRRLAPRYFVQTPNYCFPIEPHFLFPCFHYLPVSTRIWLIMHFRLGHYSRYDNREEAAIDVAEIRLLTKREFSSLFPEAKIVPERVLGLSKSYMAIKD
ncbi:MAG: class I SAM-dependent methyltransferase [Planctomycetes bacterium]|nr:class I SAM-dependent methyltransferase [Planctomycetota bacterium]